MNNESSTAILNLLDVFMSILAKIYVDNGLSTMRTDDLLYVCTCMMEQ